MDEEPKGIPEYVNKIDSLQKSLALASLAFQFVSTYFKDRVGNGDSMRYDHLESVVDLSHVLLIGDEEMTSSLLQLGYDTSRAKVVPAIYMGNRGGISIDSVLIRERAKVNPLIMVHEFIHRAAAQKGLQGEVVPFDEQMYQLLDFPKETRVNMKVNSREEYRQKVDSVKEVLKCFNEGITQWTALYLVNQIPEFNPPVTAKAYADEVAAVDKQFHGLSDRGLFKEQIKELILDVALTGDFSKLRAALPIGKDLKEHGIDSDLYVASLLSSVHDSFLVNRYDRILGQRKT